MTSWRAQERISFWFYVAFSLYFSYFREKNTKETIYISHPKQRAFIAL